MGTSGNSRREFMKTMAFGIAGLGMARGVRAGRYGKIQGSGDRIRLGVMGTHSRGHALATGFAKLEDADIVYICDVDERAREKTAAAVNDIQSGTVRQVEDFREILDDGSVDALAVATPDHWHAPAAIAGIQAGKHIYVEKPCGHNPREGELLLQAARDHGRVVQMGNQRRSWPFVQEAISRLREGVIGRVYYSRGWYANSRGSIGHGNHTPVPGWLNYDLWQGPAPRVPYRDNVIHYNWHWFWRWGTGESGNNGTHAIDLCRWGLEVNYPVKVTSGGGRYRFQDDWETPDTQVITAEFEDGKSMTWEGLSCNPSGLLGTGFGASFHGDDGALILLDSRYKIYDLKNKVVEEVSSHGANVDLTGSGFNRDAVHFADFLQAVRNGTHPNSDIEGGHKSVLLVHLGNIAQRTGNELHCDPRNGHILDNEEAARFWARDYEPGWAPTV